MKQRFKALSRGKQYARVIGAIVAAALVTSASGCSSTTTKTVTVKASGGTKDQSSKSPGEIAQERTANEPPPPPKRQAEDPKGSAQIDCEYVLGDFNESGDPTKGFRFIAGGELKNEGNVGIRVRVTYKWKQVGSAPVKIAKTYKVKRGQTRDVNVSVPVAQDQIDLIQAVSSGKDCSSSTTIVSTFGQTPYEET